MDTISLGAGNTFLSFQALVRHHDVQGLFIVLRQDLCQTVEMC
jgi:hypothetical protein